MHRLLIVLLSLAVSLPVAAAGGGAASPTPATTVKAGPGTAAVKAANEKISTLLKQKPAAGSKEEKELASKVTTSVRDFLDIDELGKRAMADQWAKLTKDQQNEFL